MAIDTSIYNPLMRPVRSAAEYAADYGALEDQNNTRQVNRLQLQSARQAAADEQGIRNALAGGSDASPQGIINQLYSARTPVAIKRAMEMEKSLSDAEHVRAQTAQATATTGKLTTETQKTAWEQAQAEHKQAIRDLADQRSPADAIAGLQRGIQQGRINFMEAQPYMEQLQALHQSGNPADFAQWQMGMLRKTLSSEDALASKKLHFTTTNTGGKTILQGIDQYSGQPVSTQIFTNTASPDAVLSASTSRANNQATIAAGGLRWDGERGGIVNMHTGEFRPATQGGVPVAPKDSGLTEVQAKAQLFGSRMQAANKILSSLEDGGETSGGRIKGFMESAGRVVGLGHHVLGDELSGAFGNTVNLLNPYLGGPNESQRKYAQAKENFISAVLRKESGAAIGRDEYERAEKLYFPQVGDTEAVIKQKRQDRERAEQLISSEVPLGKRTGPMAGAAPYRSASQPPQPGVIDFGSLR